VSGCLNLVSVGPGYSEHLTEAAQMALRQSDLIVSYELYLTWIMFYIAGKEVLTTPRTQERERAEAAVSAAKQGRTVSMVSSGDIGIYAMAALVFELMKEEDTFAVKVLPGVTAATSCASILGSPLSHDFATLSLSDLLCPFQWIEERARAIASADLCCVLYNVQSERRQDGVYRILDILLSGKSGETICGVVKNAYRPGQKSYIATLAQLKQQKFDMLTTIIVGNRFTQKKRDWIYTPRGYGSWPEASVNELAPPPPPVNAVWVFSGTSDGNEAARQIAESGRRIVVSVAGEYGAVVGKASLAGAHFVSGRLGLEQRKELMKNSSCRAIVDATHPYADKISIQLRDLSEQLNIPYVRLERESKLNEKDVILCDSAEEAAAKAISIGKRIFLATGSKEIETYLQSPGAENCQWFLRLIPDLEMMARAVNIGIPADHICAMQGPFSQDFNEALWRNWQIDCVISKDSGTAGGAEEKLKASQSLGIPLVVIKRPGVADFTSKTSIKYSSTTFGQDLISSLSQLGV
jgi:cobalt-factor III methyltransferase